MHSWNIKDLMENKDKGSEGVRAIICNGDIDDADIVHCR